MKRGVLFLSFALLPACSRSAAAPAPAPAPAESSSAAVASAAVAPKKPPSEADAIRDAVLASSKAYETLRSLVDEVGPRLTGSPGDRAAVEWGMRTLKAAGLEDVHTEKVIAPHWERGEESGELVAPYPHELSLTALGGSVGTPPAGLEAELVRVESLDAIDKLDPALVQGKIVFYDVPTERTRTGEGYGRSGRVRWLGPARAAARGAVGVVIRSIGTDTTRLPHTGGMRYEDGGKKIPAAALAIPDADMLARLIADGQKVKIRMTLGAKILPDVETANVVGDVKGSEAKDEIVLLGAHLDSWDLGEGAIDDGAGCAVVIEAGRQMAKLSRKPRRTLRVVLFANEESGLRGARAYAKAHEPEVDKHIVALEADLGAGKVFQTRFLGAESARPRFVEIASALSPLGVETTSARAHGGADIGPLIEMGVPAIDLGQDASLYFDIHHTANDTLAQVRKEDLDQVAAAFTTVAFEAARASFDFGRAPKEAKALKH